jgi:hypothetical protein
MLPLFGIVLLVLGFLSLLFAFRQWWQAKELMSIKLVDIAHVKEGGRYAVTGEVQCDSPIILPNWQTPCVYYSAIVQELVSDDYQATDGSAADLGRWRLAGSKSEQCAFTLVSEDGATIEVDPQGAQIEGLELKSDRQGANNLASALLERDCQGTQLYLKAIKLKAPVSVLGRVEMTAKGPVFKSCGQYVISCRPLAEIGQEKRLVANLSLYLTLFASFFGGLCLIISVR